MSLKSIIEVLKSHSLLFSIVISLYLLFIIFGIIIGKRKPKFLVIFLKTRTEQGQKQIEKIFGKYRDSVRNGKVSTILKCSFIVFGLNTLGLIQNTILSALLIPLVLQLGFAAIMQGISFSETKGSSLFSLLSYYFVGGLEWITYPLANFAGILFTSSIITSIINKRNILLLDNFSNVISVLFPCVIILFFQGFLELLYIRKVLVNGGTANPLQPY